MSDIAFSGSSESKYIVDEILKQQPYDDLSDISDFDILMTALLSQEYTFLIIDLDYYPLDAAEIKIKLNQVKSATTAQIICFTVGYDINTPLVKNLRSIGLDYFITSDTIGGRKQQLQDCLDGKVSIDQLSRSEQAELISTEAKKHDSKVKTIGFIGTQSRIGTTTQAIQFAKYLQFCGFNVCYIEANENGHIAKIPDLYTVEEENELLGLVRYTNLDMYADRLKISEIKQKKYDVYIFDFGVLKEEKLFSYLDKDIKVLVGGTKPWEINFSSNALALLERQDIQYIFSFTENALRNDFKSMMGKQVNNTYFCEPVFNMFSLNSNDEAMHKSILKSLGKPKSEPQKIGFFRRRKK